MGLLPHTNYFVLLRTHSVCFSDCPHKLHTTKSIVSRLPFCGFCEATPSQSLFPVCRTTLPGHINQRTSILRFLGFIVSYAQPQDRPRDAQSRVRRQSLQTSAAPMVHIRRHSILHIHFSYPSRYTFLIQIASLLAPFGLPNLSSFETNSPKLCQR